MNPNHLNLFLQEIGADTQLLAIASTFENDLSVKTKWLNAQHSKLLVIMNVRFPISMTFLTQIENLFQTYQNNAQPSLTITFECWVSLTSKLTSSDLTSLIKFWHTPEHLIFKFKHSCPKLEAAVVNILTKQNLVISYHQSLTEFEKQQFSSFKQELMQYWQLACLAETIQPLTTTPSASAFFASNKANNLAGNIYHGFVYKITTTAILTKTNLQKMLIKFYLVNFLTDQNFIEMDKWCDAQSKDEIDAFSNFNPYDFVEIEFIRRTRFDEESLSVQKIKLLDYPNKPKEPRIEFAMHTKMSAFDGLNTVSEILKTCQVKNIKAVAICDYNNIHQYPVMQQLHDDRLIYGCEINLVNDLFKDEHCFLLNYGLAEQETFDFCQTQEFVVIDVETNGLDGFENEIIEFGACRIRLIYQPQLLPSFKVQILSECQVLIRPKSPLPTFIQMKTNISNDLLTTQGVSPEAALIKIKSFLGDSVLVAHNAEFDFTFLQTFYRQQGLELKNGCLDTLNLARISLDLKSYTLKKIAMFFKVVVTTNENEQQFHRALYDAKTLAACFQYLCASYAQLKLSDKKTLQLRLKPKLRGKRTKLLLKSQAGMKPLFNLISQMHTKYITSYGEPRYYWSQFDKPLREQILIGSSLLSGEIWELALSGYWEKLHQRIQNYDYVEIGPLECFQHLCRLETGLNKDYFAKITQKIIQACQTYNVLYIATSNPFYCWELERKARYVLIHSETIAQQLHYLYRQELKLTDLPANHLLSAVEMRQKLSFLPETLIQKAVIDYPEQLFALIQTNLKPVQTKLFIPTFKDAKTSIIDAANQALSEKYGPNPDLIIKNRFQQELTLISTNFCEIYFLAREIVLHSNQLGYIVGSRGSVGSSFIAFLLKITEINPLPAHYYCHGCQRTDFSVKVDSGFDLKPKLCHECQKLMLGEGQNILFEAFTGIDGKKIPDIDLNIASLIQDDVHQFLKQLVGPDNAIRAGTINTIAEKLAPRLIHYPLYDYQKTPTDPNYLFYRQQLNLKLGKRNVNEWDQKQPEFVFLAARLFNTKKTCGQHPGGIMVVPSEFHINDFTPIQYAGNKPGLNIITTHFEYEAIHNCLLKLDLLGHVDPLAIKILMQLTNTKLTDISFCDEKVQNLFLNLNYLDSHRPPEWLGWMNSAVGLPEFGTETTRKIINVAKPQNFSDLVRVCGLAHGKNVWRDNGEVLVKNHHKQLADLICCRDDILIFLVKNKIGLVQAYAIMEQVRKGLGLNKRNRELLISNQIPTWYIDACGKISYIFPKAHAVAYTMMAWRIAWYKIYYSLAYYAVYFSLRCDKYDLGVLLSGKTELENILKTFKSKSTKLSAADEALVRVYEVALEFIYKGYVFLPPHCQFSTPEMFVINQSQNGLYAPWQAIDGLGENVAQQIVTKKALLQTSTDFLNNIQGLNKTVFERIKRIVIFSE